jgi:hypothetical protein
MRVSHAGTQLAPDRDADQSRPQGLAAAEDDGPDTSDTGLRGAHLNGHLGRI